MNLNFDYIDTIRKNYRMLICKFCNMPLVRPMMCTKCSHFMCQVCPLNGTSNRCCDTSDIVNLNEGDDSFNGNGAIASTLGQFEILCAVNNRNGCKWIGTRAEYLGHYYQCLKNYNLCAFGCGLIVNNDDVQHLNTCEYYDNWNKSQHSNFNGANNSLCQLKSVQLENHILKAELQQVKNNNLSVCFSGIIEASDDKYCTYEKNIRYCSSSSIDDDNNYILVELTLPDEDAKWMISIHMSWKSCIPGLSDHNQAIDQAIKNTCAKHNLQVDLFENGWSSGLETYVFNESVKYALSSCDPAIKENIKCQWRTDIKEYAKTKSTEHVKNKYNLPNTPGFFFPNGPVIPIHIPIY